MKMRVCSHRHRGSLGRRMSDRQESAFGLDLDVKGAVDITLEEAFAGKEFPVEIHRRVSNEDL